MSIPFPEIPLSNPEPIEVIQAEIDEIADQIGDLATSDEFGDEFSEEAFHWAAMIRNDLPTCCAGHRLDALAAIQYQSFMVVQICKASGCPEEAKHAFITKLVRIIGVIGRKIALKGYAPSHRN